MFLYLCTLLAFRACCAGKEAMEISELAAALCVSQIKLRLNVLEKLALTLVVLVLSCYQEEKKGKKKKCIEAQIDFSSKLTSFCEQLSIFCCMRSALCFSWIQWEHWCSALGRLEPLCISVLAPQQSATHSLDCLNSQIIQFIEIRSEVSVK